MTGLSEDRQLRLWRLVAEIAKQPGMKRGELRKRYALSLRQMQNDLLVVRDEWGLPLVRKDGYRFDETLAKRSLRVSKVKGKTVVTIKLSYAVPCT